MATYVELYELANSGVLLSRVQVAMAAQAHAVFQEAAPPAARKQWAEEALASPRADLSAMAWYVLVANAGATVAQINAVTDAAILTAVAAAVTKRKG